MLGEEDGVGIAFLDEVGLGKVLDDVIDAAIMETEKAADLETIEFGEGIAFG